MKKITAFLMSIALVLSVFSGISYAEEELYAEPSIEISIETITEDEEISEVVPRGVGDNDELLMEYLEQSISVSEEPAKSVFGLLNLSGINATLYVLIKTCATEVADGDRSSTTFTFSMSDVGLDGRYTASDLGVQAVVSGGKITEEGKTALKAKLSEIDLSSIVGALLYDCPEEFYWYDKTTGAGCHYESACSISGTYDNSLGEYVIFFTDNSILTFSFTVAQEYAVNNASGTFEVDTDVTQAIQTAIAHAEEIISVHATETDYQKLVSYKDEICNAVSYNTEAANNQSYPYGNPWQLIWVFDEDDDTNVVCEGYSKAFQFLCDESKFNNSKIQSRMVSGTMSGGTGAGRHMWNVITMEDDLNYLVDVTNCDSGTAGNPDKLFLVGDGDGSVETGYSIAVSSQRTIQYIYDTRTRDVYSDSDLVLAAKKYTPGSYTFTVDDISGTFTYNGSAHKPSVTVKDGNRILVKGTDYTVTYANNVNAGTARVTVKGKGDYVDADPVTKTFTIGKATRSAPTVGHTDETMKGKADGTITGLTTDMQYKKDGADYQNVTSGTLTGLVPGTYYVRYKETNNYFVSAAATVEIAASTFQVAFSIELNDGIIVRAYVINVPEGTSPSDYTLKYQYMDEAEGSYTLKKTTDKKIVASVNAPEMTEPVHVKLLYKGNEIYAKDYTVRDYCETQISINKDNPDPEMKAMVDLCYALLDYGTFAQERFGVNVDEPANATYSRADEVLALTIPETLMTEDRKTGDITKVQTSLNLMSKTEMYFYFTPASGVKLSDITFEVQKNGASTTEYTVSRKNGQAIVKVKGIKGPELGDMITVKAKVKGTLSDTVNASPISYLYTAQGIEGLEDLSKGVYYYYLKAKAYFK